MGCSVVTVCWSPRNWWCGESTPDPELSINRLVGCRRLQRPKIGDRQFSWKLPYVPAKNCWQNGGKSATPQTCVLSSRTFVFKVVRFTSSLGSWGQAVAPQLFLRLETCGHTLSGLSAPCIDSTFAHDCWQLNTYTHTKIYFDLFGIDWHLFFRTDCHLFLNLQAPLSHAARTPRMPFKELQPWVALKYGWMLAIDGWLMVG